MIASVSFTLEEAAIVEEFHKGHRGLSVVYDRLYGMLLANSDSEFQAKAATMGFLVQLDAIGLQLVPKS